MKNLTKIILSLIFSLLTYNGVSQFEAYRAEDAGGMPDCGSVLSGTEIWGGMGITTISECVAGDLRITNYVLAPYGPGWFGDTGDELYFYDGTRWNMMPDMSCAGGGGPSCDPAVDTIFVSTTGDDATGTGSSGCPFKNLSQAIISSSPGGVIKIGTGTYAISSQITLGSINDFALTIIGGSSDASQTILEAGGANRLIYGGSSFHNGASEAWTWKNMTIRNFNGADGSTFYMKYADAWTFSNIIFSNNGSDVANVDGGVLYAFSIGSAVLSDYWNFNDCVFDGNYVTGSGEDGGVMRAYDSYINFNRCIFKNNKADDYGGAIYFWSKGSYYFYDCLFYKNWTETDDGGAVGVQSSTSSPYNDVYFINCTFTKNTAGCGVTYSATNSVLYVYGGAVYSTDSDNDIYFYNTILYGNDGSGTNFDDVYRVSGNIYYYYSCIGVSDADGTGIGEGVIQTGAPYYNLPEGTDPLFTDAISDDFSLRSSSPTKNTGCSSCPNSTTASTTDLIGSSRSLSYDIGSYEFQNPSWSGGVDADWTNASNWQTGAVPTSTSDVIITSGSNIPAVTTDVAINSLVIDAGASLTVSNTSGSGTSFAVSTDLTVNGTLAIGNDVPIEVTGSGSITFGGSSTTSAADIKVSGAYTLGSNVDLNDLVITGTLTTGSKSINLSGDLTVTSTLDAGTGTITLDGTSAQTITTGGNTLYNTTINNSTSGDAITISGDMTVGNTLTLTDGIIATGSDRVIVSSTTSASISGGSSASFVNGNLRKNITTNTNTYALPIGKGNAALDYYPADFRNNSLAGVNYLDVSVSALSEIGNDVDANLRATEDGNDIVDVKETAIWVMTPDGIPSGGDYGVNLYIGNISGLSNNEFYIVKRSSASTNYTDWDTYDGTTTIPADDADGRTLSSGYATKQGFTLFSDFGIGDGSSSALPIELLSFEATMSGNRVMLTWTTATEINNDYFTVERTLDGILFEEVIEMPGAGNSFVPLTYVAYDNNPVPGLSYYRLKQTDYDGQFEYSSMVELDNSYVSEATLCRVIKSDNTKVILDYQVRNNIRYDLYVYDITGKIVKHDIVYSEEGHNQYELDIRNYRSGTYFITLQNNNEIYSDRFIVR
jgi:hypothetical protein